MLALTGAHAVAETMRQINPGLFYFSYNSTNSIVEKFSEFYAMG